MPKEQSSEELSSLASEVLQMKMLTLQSPLDHHGYNALLRKAKRLAGSVLTQDENPEEAEDNDDDHPSGSDDRDLPGGIFDDRDS